MVYIKRDFFFRLYFVHNKCVDQCWRFSLLLSNITCSFVLCACMWSTKWSDNLWIENKMCNKYLFFIVLHSNNNNNKKKRKKYNNNIHTHIRPGFYLTQIRRISRLSINKLASKLSWWDCVLNFGLNLQSTLLYYSF